MQLSLNLYRILLLVLFGLVTGLISLEIFFRFMGIGAPIDKQSLSIEWLPKAPIDWHKANDFHVWLRPGSGRIEYRDDLENSLVHAATHHISQMRTRGQEPGEYPPEGQRRIIALGDSVTFGQGVNDEETFLHLFDAQLKQHEVLNAAVPTWGMSQYLSYLQSVAPKYNADEIILFFYVNDFLNPDYYYDGELLPRFSLPSPTWSQSEKGLRRLSYIYNQYRRQQEREKLHALALGGHNSYLRLIETHSQLRLGKSALQKIGTLCQSYGWRCTLVTLPLLEDASTEDIRPILDKAVEYALEADIKVIRMENSLNNIHIYDRWIFPCDQHMSSKAHSSFAHTLTAAYKELYTEAR